MMNDLAQRAAEEQCRTCEIEDVLTFEAEAAQSVDCRRRLAAFDAEGPRKWNQTRPAFRTCPSPPALLNMSVTLDTRDWEQEIENVIEQSAFGETQRANSV